MKAGQLRTFPTLFVGNHEDLSKDRTLPFRYVDKLGVGASAVVDIVEDLSNGQLYAHKIFRTYSGRDKFFKTSFKNEIDIMKRLSPHPHIVQICWSYTRGRELGMLLFPMASDKDLGAYLLAIQDTGEPPALKQACTLLQAFGCLASGLAYIHSHTIRHKDIKPQNIFVHQGCMMFTDFGIAFDASNQATTTTGMSEAFTKRYCAPEILNHLPRNRSSDVFSLGCVFLEIVAVLWPSVDVGSEDPRPYCVRVGDIEAICASALEREEAVVAFIIPLSLCKSMMCIDRAARVSAKAILRQLSTSCNRWLFELYFCEDCVKHQMGT